MALQIGRPTPLNGSRNGSNAPTPSFNQNIAPVGMPYPSNALKNSRGFPPVPMGSNSSNLINGAQLQGSHPVSNKFIQVFFLNKVIKKIKIIFSQYLIVRLL